MILGAPHSKQAYHLFHEATKTLADIETTGIRIDMDYLNSTLVEKKHEINNRVDRFFKETELGIEWKKHIGRKAEFTNNNQLGSVLYDHLKITPKKKTKKGQASTDNKALQKLTDEVDGIDELLSLRKLEKAITTYLIGIKRETTNGLLHPMFSLNIARSFRSSSQFPNFQNFPIRDPEIGMMIRNCFIPSDDYFFGEGDYSGLEVHIGCCYHNDPQMVAYLEDPDLDMHRDMAAECFFIPTHGVPKLTRYIAKNMFVFPEFYGSYYEDVAKGLWEGVESLNAKNHKGINLRQHLKSKGINNYEKFEEHIKSVEDSFWNDRFPVYTAWKEAHYAEYLKKGYFVSKTGFVYQGMMRRNQVINFPVQGSAFHCLLWSLIRVNKEFKRRKMRSRVIGQIHDSMVLNIHANEVEDVFKIIWRISCEEIRKEWKWINIPLKVEFELAPQNKSWFYKQELPFGDGYCDWASWNAKLK